MRVKTRVRTNWARLEDGFWITLMLGAAIVPPALSHPLDSLRSAANTSTATTTAKGNHARQPRRLQATSGSTDGWPDQTVDCPNRPPPP